MADKNESKEIIKIDFQTNADQAARDVNNLNVNIEQTTDSVDDNARAINKQDEAYKSFKTQLREANAELQRAVQIYGETSVEAIKAAQGVAELRDTMEASSDLVETFNPDQKFKALGAATQLAATGVQGVTAGMALFGDQSEDTEKMLLKVQAAMAFSDAISNLSNLSDQWNILRAAITSNSIAQKANTAATGAAAIAQNLFTGSVNTTSVGFKVLKGAIAATGIGLLVVGVTALINNFDKVKEVILNAVPGLEKVGEFIGKITTSITDFIGVTSETDRIIDKNKEAAKKQLEVNKKYLEEHESQLSEETKAKIEAKNRYLEVVAEQGRVTKERALELNRQLKKIDDDKKAEDEKNRKEAAEKEKAAREKAEKERLDAEKKRKEDAQKKIDEENKKRAEEYQKELDELSEHEEELARAKELIQEDSNAKEIENANIQASTLRTISDEEDADKANRLEADKQNKAALLSQGEQLIKNVAQLAGKNKAIQKAAIIADGAVALGKAGINTAEAVTKDLAKGAPFSAPLVALDIAVGATSAAAIVSNTSRALQAVGGGSAPAAPSTQSAPSGINAAPQTGFQASSENQIATSISKANQLPVIKTFVVASDVTDQQVLDSKLKNENSFGGVGNP